MGRRQVTVVNRYQLTCTECGLTAEFFSPEMVVTPFVLAVATAEALHPHQLVVQLLERGVLGYPTRVE